MPVLHASGDMAQEVRERMIAGRFDCIAIPLPPSVQEPVEQAIGYLPHIHIVVQSEEETEESVNFIPVDPCQPLIMGIRGAMAENIPREYIDRDVSTFFPDPFVAPDSYALKKVSFDKFATALLPTIGSPPPESQQSRRIAWMAFRLHELELYYESILCLCHVADWPWLREAYRVRKPYVPPEKVSSPLTTYSVSSRQLYFVLGELPFITNLYETRRADLREDTHLSIDGMKELLLMSRTRWMSQMKEQSTYLSHWVTPQLIQRFLQYVRNLALLDRGLTPDLYNLVLAAKQMAGDSFAIALLETAKTYSLQDQTSPRPGVSSVGMGIDKIELPDGTLVIGKNRLQGPPLHWRPLALQPQAPIRKSKTWGSRWNPYRQCSWPPEDTKIESFTEHIRNQARTLIGVDLARTEKFSTSLKDGLDIRETLRHWGQPSRQTAGQSPVHELYVRENPPARGQIEAVIFLFDSPAKPEMYTWRTTWYAEHQQESTLCFYATPFQEQMVGPGIAESRYGGALFLFPPRVIPDIWEDPQLAALQTLEERLIGAAALYSRESHIALVAPHRPQAKWRQLVKRFQKNLISIPLSRFSGQTIDRLRRFHVLNGHEIRSYAAKFIQ